MSVAYRSTCRPTLGRCVDRDVSVNIATDISVDMSTDTSRSTHRPRVGRYVDRHIGRASVDMLTDSRPICRSRCQPTYRSRGS